MIEFLDPRAPTQITRTPYELSIDLAREKGVTVGFLANGFPDSVAFLDAVATAMTQSLSLQIKHWNKGNASISVSQTMLNEIKSDCSAVIAAYGH